MREAYFGEGCYGCVRSQNTALVSPDFVELCRPAAASESSRGAPVSSTDELINTALGSYTQPGVSCAMRHQNASPLGVSLPLPPFGEAWDPLHTISFLLQNAKSNGEGE